MTSTCGGWLGLGPQGVALLDAEPVLLVDHDQAEVGEVDALVEQRVGADDDAGRAGRRPRASAARRAAAPSEPVTSATRVPLGSPSSSPARPSGPSRSRDAAVVLGGEHLGRREQRRLPARVDHLEHRPQRARPSCRSRPRPAAAGASGAARPGRRRSPRRPRAARRSARRAGARRRPPAGRRRAAAAAAPASDAARCLRCTSVSWTANASSHLSRRRALASSSREPGRWISRRAVPSATRLRRRPDRSPAAGRPAAATCRARPVRTARSSRSARPRPPGRPGSARRRTPRSPRLASPRRRPSSM